MGNTENGDDIEQDIKNRAYAIWEAEGRPEGRHLDHWRQATAAAKKEAQSAPGEAAPVEAAPAEAINRKPKLPRV
jgi:Protein of unknown function (DUF2934)